MADTQNNTDNGGIEKAGGKSIYDIQREQAATQADQLRQQRQQALKRRVAAQNISGSGIQESAQRQIEQDVGNVYGQGVTAANAAEAAAKQAQQTAATQQQYQKELQSAQIASTEKIAMGDLSLREKQLAQQGAQFTTEEEFKKYALEKQYTDAEEQRAWQAMQNEKAQQATASLQGAQIASTEKMQSAQIASAEKLAYSDLSLREKQLAQQGTQFASQLDFNKWATQQGFTEQEAQRVWQANQNSLDRQQKGELTLADLNEKEREFNANLAQQGYQFNTEEDFKKYALQAGLDDNAAARVWQAGQNDKDRQSREALAYAGINEQDKQLAMQAKQFDSQLEWQKEAARMNLDDAAAARTWDAAQKDKAIESSEKVAFAQMDLQDKQYARQALEFDNQLAWQKEAARLGIDQQNAQNLWQAAENDKAQYAQERITQMNNDNKIEIEKMAGDIQAGTMTLQAELDKQKSIDQAKATSYYNMGLAAKDGQTKLSALDLSALQKSDPLAYSSYQAGVAGRSYADVQQNQEALSQYRALSIMNLDEKSNDYQAQVQNIFKSTGVNAPNIKPTVQLQSYTTSPVKAIIAQAQQLANSQKSTQNSYPAPDNSIDPNITYYTP